MILYGTIVTTKPKAAECRGFIEHLIQLGKDGSLHARRQAAAMLGNDKTILRRLFVEVAPKFAARNGGYTRILHGAFRAPKKEGKAHALPLRPWAFHSNRLGDNSPRVVFAFTEAIVPVTATPEDEGGKEAKPASKKEAAGA